MADLSDVEIALVDACRAAVPDISTVIARGWPTPSQLSDALKANRSIVSVFSLPGLSRNTSRYSTEWRTLYCNASMTLAYANGSATFTGNGASGGLVVGVKIGAQTWIYQVHPTDTAEMVAASMAMLVPGAAANGSSLILPTNEDATVRLAAPATVFRELERQMQGFRITVWSPNPAARDALCSSIGSSLAAIDFLQLPDGTAGWKQYESTFLDDKASAEGLWKRDLRYRIEYATIQTVTAQEVLFPDFAVSLTQN